MGRLKRLALLAGGAGVAAAAVRRRRGSRADATTVEEPGIEIAEPPMPAAVRDVTNAAVEALLRSPLHGIASDDLALVTFVGRSSGTEYTTPVGYHDTSETADCTILTTSDWWRNVVENPEIRLLIRGKEYEATAKAITDPGRVADHVERFVARNGVDAARRIALRIEGGRLPDRKTIEAGVDGLVVLEAELDEGPI